MINKAVDTLELTTALLPIYLNEVLWYNLNIVFQHQYKPLSIVLLLKSNRCISLPFKKILF